jgi:ABC-type transport system involved in multi-copper enzyme maturation permease subunit
MKSIFSTIWTEGLKIRKSKMLWITILAFLFIPLMMGLLLFVVKNPEFSSKLGMIGTKAAMLKFGNVDWQTYFGLLNQIIAGVGLIGFGFVTSWVFGREYSDRTVKDLLALPVSRSSIVLSKFMVVIIWCVLLSFILFAFGLIAGGIIQLSGWSSEIAFHSAYIFTVTSLLTILLCTPVAFFASYGRGYLSPIGFVIIALAIAQFIWFVGLGPYFPWAIPVLYTGAAGAESAQLGISVILSFF